MKADLARDGSEAIAAVLEKRYDLVLMDVQMPVVDGVTATQEIRSQVPADRQPVICGLTAHATTEYRDICLRAGMNGYLIKPLDPEKLRELVADLSARPVFPEAAASDLRLLELSSAATMNLPAEAVREVIVSRVTPEVFQSLNAAGAVRVSTRSGGDEWHGNLFGSLQDKILGLAGFPSSDSDYSRQQYGFGGGGAMIKDKAFLFIGGERTKQDGFLPA